MGLLGTTTCLDNFLVVSDSSGSTTTAFGSSERYEDGFKQEAWGLLDPFFGMTKEVLVALLDSSLNDVSSELFSEESYSMLSGTTRDLFDVERSPLDEDLTDFK